MFQTKNKSLKVIDLLRHGETTAGHCFIGSTDAALTETGWLQMQTGVANQHYDCVISSPLKRCIEFAQHYTARHAIACSIEPDFREYDFGEWEGKTAEALWASDSALLTAFWDDPTIHVPPGAEAFQGFQTRVAAAIDKHIQAFNGESMLVVAHGGVIRQILASQLSLTWLQAMNIKMGHGECLRLSMVDKNYKLLSVNECETM